MGQIANILALDVFATVPPGTIEPEPGNHQNARLIPGSAVLSQRKKSCPPHTKVLSGAAAHTWTKWLKAAVLPGVFGTISPAMLGEIIGDLIWISCLFAAERSITGQRLNGSMLALYLLGFILLAGQAGLYRQCAEARGPQLTLAGVLAWNTLLAGLALRCSSSTVSLLPIFLWSTGNWLALSARREIWRSFTATSAGDRNVMVIGNASLGHSIAEAIRQDPRHSRTMQEFLLDRSLRMPVGVEMMARIARRHHIDEVIVATADPVAARIAVREARRNQLDVTIVPDLHGEAPSTMECIEGLPMLKISEQKFPEWKLALKRVADVMLSLAGLVSLAPLLVAVAILIKLDSAGPILYRAERVGRKGRHFYCYKLRTMVRHADELKEALRIRNQRQGAFFKIENDPRITRMGRVLRRYSIDELPQLWNVLCGDMSLVGPRPHPADDVQRYDVPDLRRLDFVPGITGLWQVTARRDPSFKRSVQLDIEYIDRWSMALDLKILCRTVSAVLQGSGA